MGGSQPVSFRDIKIAELMPIVRKIAGRICRRLPSYIDIDDLISAGHIAAIDCADKFDASQAATWKSFSSTRIHGAMIDHLREVDEVARSVRTRAKRLREARQYIELEQGRKATRQETADRLEIPLGQLEHFESSAIEHRLFSIDTPLHDDTESGTTIGDTLVDESDNDQSWLNKQSLLQLLKRLPEREAKIVELYILEGWKHHEIGKILGVTESRICQLLGQAIKRIKQKRTGLTTTGELAPIIRPRVFITHCHPIELLPSSPIVIAPATVLVAIKAVVPPSIVAPPVSLLDQLAAIRARMHPPTPVTLLHEQLSRHLARLRAI